ncbi:Predicted transcriptional regulator [Vibrio chagasii]|nr:Predicted transcriptional regulator [Vibrio chagasii]CAH6811086.1 Predicted transcriptional regulator [Vibrio chagasii]CAH6889401.1 Predicted transcriptional regulator [Vibrio chagasii]CAH6916388.1 Predicted transcriptional regulator [Vibrio chagasii]CAH6929344.1 Predicted transcriptional regulator [Vibrio chagasii]
MSVNKKIEPFEYIGGRDFTSKVVNVMNLERYNQLTEVLGVNKGTISTWHTRNMTPFELAVRIHLSEGVSLKWLLLDEGEPFPEQSEQDHVSQKNEAKTLFDIDYFSIDDGKLVGERILAFDKTLLDELGVSNVMAIKDGTTTFLINKESRQAVSGTYLVDMDGLLSLNDIQRLPGKKLAISFNGSTLTVEEDEVRVVGRVALVMDKR